MPLHNNLAPDRMRLLGGQWLVVGVLLCVTVNLLLMDGVKQTLGRQRQQEHGPAEEAGGDPALIGCPWLSPGDGRDQRPDPGRLRIATFNAEWLFDGVDDPSHVPWPDPAAAQTHLVRVAEEVAALDADVLNLVEVEGCFMLQRLLAALPLAQRERLTPFVIKGSDSATRQQAGLVSTLAPTGPLRRTEGRATWPIPGSACGYRGEGGKSTGVSKHWWGVWSVPGLSAELLIVGAHLKARPTEPRSCAQREAQASVLAELVRQEGFEAGRHVVLMGDLNDFDEEVPDAEGNTPTSAVLRMLSSELGLHRYSPVPSTPGFGPWHPPSRPTAVCPRWSALCSGSNTPSWLHRCRCFADSVAERLSVGDRFTWEGERYPRAALDHILLSEGLLPLIESVEVEGRGASDHRALLVELRLKDDAEPGSGRPEL